MTPLPRVVVYLKTEYHMECVGVLCGIYVVVDFLSQVIFIFLLLVSLD